MIQISFHPAYDAFHGTFRLFRLLPIISELGSLPADHVRILDFYLLFPFRIEGMRLSNQHRHFRKLSTSYQSARPYGEQPEDQTVFARMAPFQEAAFQTLAFDGFIERTSLEKRTIQVTRKDLPREIVTRTKVVNDADAELLSFLSILASQYSLTGPNGLKARTGLLEYRYDAA